jgi:serine/threonine-protein kinase
MTDLPTSLEHMPDATPVGELLTVQPNDPLQTCRICRYEFRASAKLMGKKIPCAHCGAQVEVVNATNTKADPLIGKRIGNCRLNYRLGAGGIGLVYAGDQLSVGRKIAIKMLGAKAGSNEILVQRFQREAKLSAQLNHSGVVQVYDCGFDRGVHFQIMELVEGGTLANLIETHLRLPWREAIELGFQLALALDYIHSHDIIHRDIKPANILITNEGGQRLAKLADLGLAKQLDDEQAQMGLTMEGKPLGSPSYMPPEQVRNAKDATRVSDIYGLGATLYATITGHRPFDGKTSYEVMANVLTKEVVPPLVTITDLPPALNELLLSCLAKDPAKRPQSAIEMAKVLEKLLNQYGRADPIKTTTPSAAWKRPEAGLSETTPPTIQQGGTDRFRRSTTGPETVSPAPGSASWKRPSAPPGPAQNLPPSPAVPTPPATSGISPLILGILLTMGALIVILLIILILK